MTRTRRTPKGDGALAFLVMGLLVTLPLAAWNGLVVSKLWTWFVVPLGSVPRLSVWAAAGVSLLARTLTYDLSIPRETDRSAAELFVYNTTMGILLPGLILLFGAVYHGLAS